MHLFRSMTLVVLSSAVLLAACNGGPLPTAPSGDFVPGPPGSGALSMTGTWSGTSDDATGTGIVSWNVTQDGTAVTATTSVSHSSRAVLSNGTVRGTLSGRTLNFHMEVPYGGFSGTMSSCSMSVDGQAQVSDDGRTITGNYAGAMSASASMTTQPCGGPTNNGQFTLSR